MFPSTAERVNLNTNRHVNDRIDARTRKNVARCARLTPPLLEQRLRELDCEWDVERVTETVVSVGLLGGLLPAALLGPGWLVVPLVFAVFLLSHALVGWTPLLPLVRRLSYRTAREIEQERYALKAIRGDFRRLDQVTTPQDREDLARFEGEGGSPAPEPDLDAAHPAVVNEAVSAVKR